MREISCYPLVSSCFSVFFSVLPAKTFLHRYKDFHSYMRTPQLRNEINETMYSKMKGIQAEIFSQSFKKNQTYFSVVTEYYELVNCLLIFSCFVFKIS